MGYDFAGYFAMSTLAQASVTAPLEHKEHAP